MKIRYSIVYVLIACCLLTSCQSTPDSSPTVEKRDIASIDWASEDDELVDIPAHVSRELDLGYKNLRVAFDTDVTVPDVQGCPVVRIVPEQFSDERINQLMGYLLPNAPIYFTNEGTREQLEAELLKYMRGRKEGDKYVPYEDIDDLIKMIEEELKNAPSQVELQPFDITKVEKGESFVCSRFYADIKAASIRGIRAGREFMYWYREDMGLQTESMVLAGNAVPDEPAGTEIEEPSISREEALQKVNQIIMDLHIEHMSITTIEKARVLLDDDPTIYGWRVCLKREAGGLSVLDLGDSYTIIREHLPAYSAPWEEERIEMFITEDGALGFLWVGASKEKEILTENARLIGFDQIIERIGRQLKYFFAWTEDNDAEVVDLVIDQIILGMSAINIKDEPDAGLLIPTWYAYYHEKDKEEYGREDWIAFSALDGSYIEPRMSSEAMQSFETMQK